MAETMAQFVAPSMAPNKRDIYAKTFSHFAYYCFTHRIEWKLSNVQINRLWKALGVLHRVK